MESDNDGNVVYIVDPIRAIPFNIHTPPTDEVSKILTPKKKRSKCRHKTPLRNLKIFPLPLRNIAEIKGCRQA
jgi:hypothetical protein